MLVQHFLLTLTAAAASVPSKGREIYIEEYPFHVSIEKEGRHTCGGSIITPTTILTAAHCVHGYTTENFQIRAGTSKLGRNGVVRSLKYIYEHPDYDQVTYHNDIAVLELKRPLEFDTIINAANLLLKDNVVADNATGFVTGWSISSDIHKGATSENLRVVELPKVSDALCRKLYPNFDASSMICFGGNSGDDACTSDSGGAIIVHRSKYIREQVGIVSFGIGCGQIGKPGVYTNILGFQDFINKHALKS